MNDMLNFSRKEIIDGKWERVLNFFRSRSMWLLYYCTGCGAIELPPSMCGRFDLERFGLGPMATPRQSDILLITGYISLKTLKRVVRSYEQMPEPKWVVGFGSCPINGGIYWDSYATINQLEKYIPVDISLAGCMPRPQAIIDALQKLMRMIDRGEAVGYKKYKMQYDWYKQNQRDVLERSRPVFLPGEGSVNAEAVNHGTSGDLEEREPAAAGTGRRVAVPGSVRRTK
jgi:NADH-quinone oxidoreductase subunit B